MKTKIRNRIDWQPIIKRAAGIVESYDTGVTLRQLFYRLVSEQRIPNTQTAYKTLSDRTAKARREELFPDLIDRTRTIHRDMSFTDPQEARDWLSRIYRRDRTEGQETAVYLGIEKHGIVAQLRAWFGDYGIRIVSLGGYSSQTYIDDIADDVLDDGRDAVMLYAGDFDPSGEDIERDLQERCPVFSEVRRVALSDDQIREYDLPENPGKETDSRAEQFEARHGRLVQVEVDALPPELLQSLFADALAEYVDMSVYEAVIEQENQDRNSL